MRRRSRSFGATLRREAVMMGFAMATLVGCAAIEGLDRYVRVDDIGPTLEAPEASAASSDVGPAPTTPHADAGTEAVADAAACTDAGCAVVECLGAHRDCNRDAADGCESDTVSDARNCGACGQVCALGETCGSSSCTTALTTGLLGYWAFDDDATSTIAKDSSPSNVNGTVVGNVTFVPGQGKQGRGAGSFAGAGHIDVLFPNDATGQGTGVFLPSGNVTFAMWVKTTSTTVQGLQVVSGSTFGGGCDRVVGNGGVGPLSYNVWEEQNVVGAATVNDGNWHHVAYVMDQTNGLFGYVDGVLDGSDATPTDNCGVGCSGFNWATDYLIGTGSGCRFSAGDFTGLIDDVRLYGRALTAADVAALFTATK